MTDTFALGVMVPSAHGSLVILRESVVNAKPASHGVLTNAFFDDVRALIVSARATVARGVDLVQVHTNLEIGRCIVEQEQKGRGRAAYAKAVLKALARKLTTEFGSGFSARNLAYMRTFYLLYQDRVPIFQTATEKLAGPRKLQTLSAKSRRIKTL